MAILSDDAEAPVQGRPAPLKVRHRAFEWGSRTYLMAILNVTPDSFSGDGLGADLEATRGRAREAIDGGADIIDIGGESTRPGAVPISADEELARVIPAVEAVRALTDLPISVDTYKARVATDALGAGADIINDVWALRGDPAMAGALAAAGCPVVLMHNRRGMAVGGKIGGHYAGTKYVDLLAEVAAKLGESLRAAVEAGIEREKTIVDPGVGFGKNPDQNLELVDRLGELRALGRPILVGVSRKSFVAHALGGAAEGRAWGTAAAVAVSIMRGADIVRVHDVREMAQVARVTDRIVRRSVR